MTVHAANIVGVGLIGGSIGLALRAQGITVSGIDDDPERLARAAELGVIDNSGWNPDAHITFVATPVGQIAAGVREALEKTSGVVTDVGSVKGPIVAAVSDPRFVAGHPMAGSEQVGVDGSRATMFDGAVWVLTPDAGTDDSAFAVVRETARSFGADVVTLGPERHDAMVAMVSHVPHLTAVTLMRLADQRADEHQVLLRLAAGGFRDMTRIASGHPGIWPDICVENKVAIVSVLDELIGALSSVRRQVTDENRAELMSDLEAASHARQNLPARGEVPADLSEIRVPIPDEKGSLVKVLMLAAEVDVNVYDIEIAHTSEGQRGVLILVVDTTSVEAFSAGLDKAGYAPRSKSLE